MLEDGDASSYEMACVVVDAWWMLKWTLLPGCCRMMR